MGRVIKIQFSAYKNMVLGSQTEIHLSLIEIV
jgi:hypothetical protein